MNKAEINGKDKEIYELQRKFQLDNQKSKQSFDELKEEIEFLARKHRLRSDIVLALWTSYLETKEARDEIKKRVLEYSQNGDDDAAKTVNEQLNYYKSKFENFINVETNCGNEKELFKKIVEIFKQKVNVISRLDALKKEIDKISFENQVLKINNETSYLEMKHYKKIANIYYSDLVSPSEIRNSE
ncbi:keratin, type II cytoskeletal 1-like [Centruroides vittatus]|uniref:keratin, type II cytoskeletal 1-like n=1 Tax=Centruroides vittatus TaxID=120091 RepID=UPI0035105BBD